MKNPRVMTRREFFTAGAGIAGAAFLTPRGLAGARGPAGFPALELQAGTSGKSRVILVKTEDRTEGVRKCLDLLGFNPFQGKNVLIKPNFNTSDETPGSTHNDTLKALLAGIRDRGAKGLAVGDRSGPEPTEQVFEKKGIRALAGAFDAELLNFDEMGPDGYVKITPPGSHWKDGFLVPNCLVEAECVVSTCCLKTHGFGGVFTMSLKNSVGAVPRKDAGIFLAGTDRVAVDAVGVAILKELGSNDAIMKPAVFAQEQIARAVELGLGVSSAEGIVIETPDPASETYAGEIRKILAAAI